ncbi:hypothetical protein HMPREF0501_00452 [Limosilactobacillus coleohominis 101-4-CHN]|uniref:DUF4355 domain-containing protein n=1 Tax=Limosilactobacillus coleohominis 101-4-CHN TaxID=575594 RepID=C7XUT6_9LACO|nr:DUF4355 domain-containing protein [Limosilactobacillus coleohominis]EEU31047.1 hypothetical protein HMPREF0501_00452 [Limosilactobacillus coleohominis 101-4-CHN]
MEEQEQPKTTDQVQNNEEPKEQPEKEAQKSFNRDELGSIVSAQIAKEREKWEAEQKQKIEQVRQEGIDEGKEMAGMSAKQLAEKEAKDREDKLKQQKSDLDQRQKQLDHREYVAHTKDLLSEQNLPTSGAEMLLGETEEETKSNIDMFKKLVDQGVRNELHRSSAGKAPQGGAPAQPQAPTKNLADMNYEEMQKLVDSQQQQ